MKPIELIQKLTAMQSDFPEASIKIAVAGFLANLVGELKIELPRECLDAEEISDRGLFYAGVIVGHAEEISAEKIKEAHLAMIFPASRAIISRLLYGPGLVTSLGVPASYGV